MLKRIWWRLTNWIDELAAMDHCNCACFCPKCRSVLNIRGIVLNDDKLVIYRCRCGHVSHWDFDAAPVPLIVPRR